jgi:short-subunit dehydrogenase
VHSLHTASNPHARVAPGASAARALRPYGPWAVVTGASDGIGRAFASHAAAGGLDVVLVARREVSLRALADELTAMHGVETRVISADLSEPAGIATVLAQTAALDVGILVAAAGFGTSGPFIDAPIERELAMIAVNCGAAAALSHHFGARFAAQKRGAIVLLSSIVAFQGVGRAANYAATKAYVQSLAEGLAVELAPFGVEVLSCAPGPVHSGFATNANMTMGAAATPSAVARGTLAALGSSRTVRPGFLSKLLGGSLALLPRWARVRVMTAIMAGMTRRPDAREQPPL